VTPLRDFFLLPANYAACRAPLVQRFGELLRKAWNTRNFKGQVGVGIRVGAAPPGKHLPPGRRRAAAQGLGTRTRAWELTTRLAVHCLPHGVKGAAASSLAAMDCHSRSVLAGAH